jgi:hypothetical protein
MFFVTFAHPVCSIPIAPMPFFRNPNLAPFTSMFIFSFCFFCAQLTEIEGRKLGPSQDKLAPTLLSHASRRC